MPESQAFKPYHPGLPSIEDAQKNYTTFLSDHIPIVANVGEIKCVSWNVMEGDAYNGASPLGKSSYGESPEQCQARYERIADAIVNILRQQQPDFFTLQEISKNNTELWSVISEQLQKTGYTPAIDTKNNVIDTAGNITLYRSDKFTLGLEEKSDEKKVLGRLESSLYQLGGHGLVFDRKTSSSDAPSAKGKIRICNVHADYNDNPKHHEQMIHAFLNKGGENDTSIVIGDFNCMVNTLEPTKQITTTSIVPNVFRNYKMQGACAIDGVFAKQGRQESAQVRSQHINPLTGDVYKLTELAISDEDKPQSQIAEEMRFRPYICLSEKPHHELEKLLKASIGDISIMPAINLRNQRGLAIEFPNQMKALFHDIGLPIHELQNQHGTTPSNVVYLPIETAKDTLKTGLVPKIYSSRSQHERDFKQQFMDAYKIQLNNDKMAYFGIFRFFRISNLNENMTMAEIIQHAQGTGYRSRSVCEQLGWLTQDGKMTTKTPEYIRSVREYTPEHIKSVREYTPEHIKSILTTLDDQPDTTPSPNRN